MRSRSFSPGVAAHIAGGKAEGADRIQSQRRLIALIGGALDEEQRILECRGLPYTILGKPMHLWSAKEKRLWGKLTKGQVALWLSGFVDLSPGGDRVAFRYRGASGRTVTLYNPEAVVFWGLDGPRDSAERVADQYGVSRRMLFMALKLRKSANAVLIRAVAEGGVSLGDAIAHLDRDKDELRKAIRMVERREARSLKQALAA
jgi:hypothetical protein